MKHNVKIDDKLVSCCGVVCFDCRYYPINCKGCREIEGKVYWLEYTGESVCGIYDCCVVNCGYAHCGLCAELPCRLFDRDDPTKTPAENAEDMKKQLEQLRSMRLNER